MAREPIRLLIVNIDLDGGAGIYCRNLATGLKRHFPGEFRVGLLLCRRRGVLKTDPELFDQIEIVGIDVGHELLSTPRAAWRLRRAIARQQTDLVLAIHNFSNLLARFIAPRRRTILTVHGHVSSLLSNSRSRPIIKPLLRRAYRNRLVIVPASDIADDLRDNFGASRIEVVPHGIDLERVRSLAQNNPADLPTQPYIASCGRLVPEKDYPTLLRAYASARRHGFSHDLFIIGDGPQRDELHALARELELVPRVVFLGHRDNPFPYVRAADFFVMSSTSEGFGLALVEAMALGKACISTDCPGGPGQILARGEFGILVPPAQPDALAEAICHLANSRSTLENLAIRALQRADEYCLKRMAQRCRDLFVSELNRTETPS